MATLLFIVILLCLFASTSLWLAVILLRGHFFRWLGLSTSAFPIAPWGLADVMLFLVVQLICNGVALSITTPSSTETNKRNEVRTDNSSNLEVDTTTERGETNSSDEVPFPTASDGQQEKAGQQEIGGQQEQNEPPLPERKQAGVQTKMLFVAISNLIAVALFCVWLLFRFGIRPYELGIPGGFVGADIKIGLVGSVMILPPIVLLHSWLSQAVEYSHQTKDQMESDPTGLMIGTAFFSAGLVAPLAEEFFYRLIFQGWLGRFRIATIESFECLLLGGRDKLQLRYREGRETPDQDRTELGESGEPNTKIMGIRTLARRSKFLGLLGILISASFFSIMHLGQGLAFIPIFFLGLGLGFVFEKTQRIVPCLIIHLVLNLWSLSIIALQPWLN